MNLNDRVALILGRALLRAETLAAELEQANERIAALNEQIIEMSQAQREPEPAAQVVAPP